MVKIIAMHLPQYHRIPENDKWWGDGFTEWRNVKWAEPLYNGHIQPRIPIHHEYYDLGQRQTLKKQMNLAKKYGIDGFCFYHYWFNGKKLLEKPIESLLQEREDVLPFCLCWANESWTRTWDGISSQKETLIVQEYGSQDQWSKHFEYLNQFFLHDKYIKKDGKPVLVIYKSTEIEKREEMFSLWNVLAKKSGFPGIFIIHTQRSVVSRDLPIIADGVMDFEPFATLTRLRNGKRYDMVNMHFGNKKYNRQVCYETIDYEKFCNYMVSRYVFSRKEHYLGFFTGWDNTPRLREKTVTIFENNTPDIFKKYFEIQYRKSERMNNEFLFINAWNEWGEGTFLEPDEKYKYGYLDAIRFVKSQNTL